MLEKFFGVERRNTEERIDRAQKAADLLGNELLTEAFTDLEKTYVEAFVKCGADDDMGRYRLAEGVKVLRAVRRHLESAIEDGQIAHHTAEEMKRGA